MISRQVAALSAVAALGLVTVAGCSSSSSPAGAAASGTAAATSAESSASSAAAGSADTAGGSNVGLTEKQLSAKFQAAAAQATAVHVKGQMVVASGSDSGSDSGAVTLDLQLNRKDASSSGTLGVGSMTVPIIATGGVIYFQMTDSLVQYQGGGSLPAGVKGKWVSSKSSLGKDLDDSFGGLSSYEGFVSGMTGTDGPLAGVSPQGTATLDGQTVAVYKGSDGSIVDVAASGPAYVLEARPAKSDGNGALDFTWNQPTTVTAPPAADIYNG